MKAPGKAGSAVRQSIVTGLVLALVALVAGIVLTATQDRTWTAESVLVVLPAADLDDATSAAYYETMSRGQIVATFAEVAGNLRFEQQAEDRLNLDAERREDVSTEVSVVPDTSVILVRATAPDARTAEQVADGVTTVASEYLAGLSKPFRTATVHSAQDSAYASGTNPLLLLVATVVVALVAGLAVQQAVYHLLVALRGSFVGLRRRRAPGDHDPEEKTAAGQDPQRISATGAASSHWKWW